jgi:hypothetical protein
MHYARYEVRTLTILKANYTYAKQL